MARYDRDILEELADHKARVKRPPTVEGVKGLVIEHAATGFVGTVTTIDTIGVRLRGDDGIQREFRLQTGAFRLKGQRVTLVKPAPGAAANAKPTAPQQTASGSVAVKHEARVAKGSRLLVEGVHDAELVEKVWGDDLRHEGIVVERLDGLDHLERFIDAFKPESGRKLGVLVDHLVAGSKEARIVERIANPHVLVTGTPYVDVWQAIRPHVVGLEAWPVIPKGTDWKTGIARGFRTDDIGMLWKKLLGSVKSYADLEPSLVGAVERLIDFVTAE